MFKFFLVLTVLLNISIYSVAQDSFSWDNYDYALCVNNFSYYIDYNDDLIYEWDLDISSSESDYDIFEEGECTGEVSISGSYLLPLTDCANNITIDVNFDYDDGEDDYSEEDTYEFELSKTTLYSSYTSTSSSEQASYTRQVHPLLNLSVSSEKVTCNDTVSFTITPKDTNYPSNSTITGEENVKYSLQYMSVGSEEWQIAGNYNLRDNKSIDLIFSNSISSDLYGKELKFRLVQTFSSYGYSNYTTDTISGIFFLAQPEFDVNPIKPACHGDEASIEITNLPYNASSVDLIVNLTQLDSQPSSSSSTANTIYVIDGDTCYWYNQSTVQVTIPAGVTTDILTASELSNSYFDISDGGYLIQVHYDETFVSSLCEVEKTFKVITPEELGVNTYATNTYNEGYNVLSPGGTGSITVSIEGGTTPYSLENIVGGVSSWTGIDSTLFTIDGVVFSSGNTTQGYTVTIDDTNNCDTVSDYVSLTRPDELTVSVDTDSVSCNGYSDGEISFDISGGIKPFSMALTGQATKSKSNLSRTDADNNYFEDLSAGSYILTVTDSAGNTASTSTINIYQPTPLSISSTVVTDVTCNSGSDGSITISATGGTQYTSGSYDYLYGKTSSNITLTDSKLTGYSSGEHTVWVKDINGCILESNSISVSQPEELSIVAHDITSDTCNLNNGTVQFDISGGWDNSYPYYIEIKRSGVTEKYSTITSTESITNIMFTGLQDYNSSSGTTYTAYVYSNYTSSDNYDCEASVEFTIYETNPMSISSEINNYASCNNIEDGIIEFTVNNGVAPYVWNSSSYSSNVFTIENCGNLRTSSISVTDYRGCLASAKRLMEVNTDSTRFIMDVTSSNTSCSTASNGSITFELGGSIGSYSYTLNEDEVTGLTNANGSKDINDLAQGEYILIVTDDANCTITDTITVDSNINPISISSISTTDEACGGAKNGTLSFNSSSSDSKSGSLSYSLILSSDTISQSNSNFSLLASGDYKVLVEDEIGCYQTDSATVGSKGHIPDPSITLIDSLACTSASNGHISVSLSGYEDDADMLYSIVLKDSLDNNIDSSTDALVLTTNNLSYQSYTLSVSDENGCSFDSTFHVSITANPISITSITASPSPCFTAANASINIIATGSFDDNGSYDFTLFDGQTKTGNDITFSDLSVNASGYVKVTDTEGCVDSVSIPNLSIAADTFYIDSVTKIQATCPGYNDGVALPVYGYTNYSLFNLEIEKADEDNVYVPYAYSASSISDTDTITDLGAGKYKLYLTDDDNCEAAYSFVINEPDSATLLFDNNLIVDKGDNTGYLEIDIANGNETFYWELSGAESRTGSSTNVIADTVFSLYSGTYQIRLQDMYKCNYEGFENSWYTYDFTIAEPDTSLTLTFEVDSVNCYDESNGAIRLNASGGWGGYSYYFNDMLDSDGSKIDIEAGEYPVKIVDKEGAYRIDTVTVYQPELLSFSIIDSIEVINASCPGYNNGYAAFSVNNGILLANDSLNLWATNSGSSTPVLEQLAIRTDTFTGLGEGSYYLHVSDRNGCVATSEEIVVTEPDKPEFVFDYNYIKAKGDSTGYINAEILKGNQDFYYQWYYQNNDSLISEGRTYSLTNQDSLFAGTYLLRVKDTAECVYESDVWMEREIEIIEPAQALSFEVDTNVAVTCNGLSDGWFRLIPVGGWGHDYLYGFTQVESEMTSDSTFVDLVADEYTVYITDTVGITYNSNIVVTEPDMLTATVDSILDVNCYNESNGNIWISAEGGNLSYLVSTDSTTWFTGTGISNLTANKYGVYIKDTLDCTIKLDSVTITEPTDIVLTDTIIRISKCLQNSGRIDVFIEGGVPDYTYLWENDSIDSNDFTGSVVDSIYSGEYKLKVIDQHSCFKNYSFYVSDLTDLTIDSVATTEVSCWGYSDGTAYIYGSNGTAPYSYDWDSSLSQINAVEMTGIASGTYVAGLLDSEGCKVYEDFYVGTPDSLGYSIVEKEDPLCLGGYSGYINLLPSGGTPEYQLKWSTGATTTLLEDINPGLYQLTITDSHQCENSFDFTFDYQRTIKPSLGLDTMICHYETLNVNPGDYTTYEWLNDDGFKSSEQSPDITDPSTYYLTVTDEDNCLGYDTLDVEVSYLDITEITVTDVTCNGNSDGQAVLSYTSGYGDHSINWPTGIGSDTWSSLSGGDYTVNISDAHGCEDSVTFSVYEPDALSLETQLLVDPYCYGVADGQIKVQGYGGRGDYEYLWSNGEDDRNNTKLDTGYYHLSYWDNMGCMDSASYTLAYQTAIYPQLGDDVTICDGNDYFLYPGEFTEYYWSSNSLEETSTDTSYVTSVPGEYYVEVMDDDYCVGRDTMEIFWRDTEIDPAFLVSSTVAVGDTVYMVEVSQPIPDSFEWYIEGNYEVTSEGTYYINVIFNETGVFYVGIDAWLDGCLAQERKKIVVLEEGESTEEDEGSSSTESMKVNAFTASPNPASEYFNAYVELSETLPVTFYLVNIGTGQIIEQRTVTGLDNYTESFDVPSVTSSLLLFIVVEDERHSIKIIAGE